MLTFENVVKSFSRDEVGGAPKVATAQAVSKARMLVNRMADCHAVVKEMYIQKTLQKVTIPRRSKSLRQFK
jgi:hypothetical protein